jgi:hypothetical protein
MRVLLVTTWGIPCGIAEHSAMLKEAVERADPGIAVIPRPDALDPSGSWLRKDWDAGQSYDVIHLNYQGALHGGWTAEVIGRARQITELPIVVTYHDTSVPNSDNCKRVIGASDAAIVHEPFDDLPNGPAPTHYWRMGVPAWEPPQPTVRVGRPPRPLLGTIGFPFPWKCYDALCRVTAAAGWSLLLIAPGATAEQIVAWSALQPYLQVFTSFVDRRTAISLLSACDATAFTYRCANAGQSGAILLGLATRKPVFAFEACRQFRALYDDPLARLAIRWVTDFAELTEELQALLPVDIDRFDEPMVALAAQESWLELGAKYAALYRSLA